MLLEALWKAGHLTQILFVPLTGNRFCVKAHPPYRKEKSKNLLGY